MKIRLFLFAIFGCIFFTKTINEIKKMNIKLTCLFFIFNFKMLYSKSTLQKRIKREDKMALCGEFDVLSMKPLQFHSNISNESKTILIADQPIGRGQIGEVYIGYSEIADQFDVKNFTQKNCVAIKKVQNFSVQIFLNGIKIWDKLQREVPLEKRQHIVQLIDYGKIGWNKYLATMEMGGAQTFYDCLQNGCFGNKNVEEFVREMVEPLKEIHQVAVHLDYKPSNLVYVMDMNTQKTLLKLIDFDSAVPIPLLNIWHGRANICEQPSPYAMITPTYICPEFYKANLVSTKTDMWAFGISVYELLLNQPMYRDLIEDVDSLIDNIAEIHRGHSIVKFEQFSIDFISDDWLEEPRYAEAIFHIIQIWTDFPQIAFLIMNVLDTDIVTRMTAIGVLDYLDGNCCPSSVQGKIYPNQFKIFHKITFQQIRERIAKLLAQNDYEIVMRVVNVEKLLETFFGKFTDWIDKIRAREAICDTGSTNF